MRRRALEDFNDGYRQEVRDPRIGRWGASKDYEAGREQAKVDLAGRFELIEGHREMGGLYALSAYSEGKANG